MYLRKVSAVTLSLLIALTAVAARSQVLPDDVASVDSCPAQLEVKAKEITEKNSEIEDRDNRIAEKITEIEERDQKIEQLTNRIMEMEANVADSVLETAEFTDCTDIRQQDPTAPTGTYAIILRSRFTSPESKFVFCDMDTEGGGWTTIQRRNSGTLNFFQNFETYAEGFGNLGERTEFWIGNRLLHEMTSRWNYELRIELENADRERKQVHYNMFKVDSECNDFSLTLDHFIESDLPDSMYSNRNMKFSTFDRDGDLSNDNCAIRHIGAWWYNNCTDSNLNGMFLPAGTPVDSSIHWYGWEQNRALASVEMKIRPRDMDGVCPSTSTPSPTTLQPTTTSTTTMAPTTITLTTAPTTTTLTTAPTGEDCSTILTSNPSASSGEYDIVLKNGKQIRVYCDMETDGGGWTMFQRRVNNVQNFFLNYNDYAVGFGNVSRGFWLGNDNLNLLTAAGDHELRVDLEDWNDNIGYAKYSSFTVRSASAGYGLEVSGYSGTAGDSLRYNNNQGFSTKDNNQDWRNCADYSTGAWWYNKFGDCAYSNLNSVYRDAIYTGQRGLYWYHWHNDYRSMKYIEMKLRRR